MMQETVIYYHADGKMNRVTFDRKQTLTILQRNGYRLSDAKNTLLNIMHGGHAILDGGVVMSRAF